MFKNLLLSLGTITVVGGIAIAGTQALLSDEVTLTANTFSTGSVDLQISTNDSVYTDTTTGFSQTVFPGHTSLPHYFWLKNNNSGVGLDIEAQAIVDDENDIDPDLVEITITAVTGGGDLLDGSTPITHTLSEWSTLPIALGFPSIDSNHKQRYSMTVTFDSSITESGAASIFDFTFTGTQVAPTE